MQFKILRQYVLPQHLLSRFAGLMANCRWPWLKNWLIKDFVKRYQVDLSLAQQENVEDYPSFNHFFTRRLKPAVRPIASGVKQIASPADGAISQIGHIEQDTILQAKGFHFSLKTLLGNDEQLAARFRDGLFATIYLAPKDYHRVHMPLTGQLRETTYIPGKLFSVNQYTANHVPNLFSRNERLVCLFDTDTGPMVVILVGAMLVGSMQTVWPQEINHKTPIRQTFADGPLLKRGEELGLFKLGSTVIVLLPKNQATWRADLQENTTVRFGEAIGDGTNSG